MNKRVIATVLGAAALALPTAAVADSGHGKDHEKRAGKNHEKQAGKGKKAKKVMFVFRGEFTAPGTVEVKSGNAHVRKGGYVGESVAFDLADAKVVVADTNADGKADVADVKDGDIVLVQARIAKRTEYAMPAEGEAAAAIVARKLVDRTNKPVEEAEPAPAEGA
jgi:hypothetical protein